MQIKFKLIAKDVSQVEIVLIPLQKVQLMPQYNKQNLFTTTINTDKALTYIYITYHKNQKRTESFIRTIEYEQGKYYKICILLSIVIGDLLDDPKSNKRLAKKSIRFILNFPFQWPNLPFIVGNTKQLGQWDQLKSEGLSSLEDNRWAIKIQTSESFEYKYLKGGMQGQQYEWDIGDNRVFDITKFEDNVEIEESWNKVQAKSKILKSHPHLLTLSIHYETKENEDMYVVGNIDQLGLWQKNKALRMRRYQNYIWNCTIKVDKLVMEYKYLVGNQKVKKYEDSENRVIHFDDQVQYDIQDVWNNPLLSKTLIRDYDTQCPICSKELDYDKVLIGQLCGHLVCQDCYKLLGNVKKCALCRKEFIIQN